MSSLRFAASSLVVCLIAAVTGCATETGEKEDVATSADDLKLTGIRYLGKIFNGETRTTRYWSPPRYRSYGFDAKAGDEVTVEVKAVNGDAVAFIADTNYNVLAYNDDVTPGVVLDSKVTYKVPSGQASQTYRIVFRDYSEESGTFTVTLTIRNTAQPDCTYGTHGYWAGDQFTASDGCNTCTCGSDGSISCTKKGCRCDPAREPWRVYKHTPEECVTIRPSCTWPQFPFSNECGCGCESPRP
jgi:hypothetical protein